MSDTPRTDAAEKHAYQLDDEFTPVCESKFARQLERELAVAKERIKRLVEAIDLVVPVCNYLHHPKRLRHDLSDPCGCEKIVREAKREAQ